MKKIIFITSCAILFVGSSLAQKPGYKLIFEDDFTDGSYVGGEWEGILNLDKWYQYPLKSGNGHEIFVGEGHHDNLPENEQVYDMHTFGQLNLTMRERGVPASMLGDSCIVDIDLDGINECPGDYNYISGLFRSRDQFQYGYFEMECKIPKEDLFFQAFWLYGQNGDGDPGGNWYNEIDIFEQVDTILYGSIIDQKLQGNVHYHSEFINNLGLLETDIRARSLKLPFDIDAPSNYNNVSVRYGLEWTPNYMIWYINDVPQRIIQCNAYTPRHAMHLYVNWSLRNYTHFDAASGLIVDPHPPSPILPAAMEIYNIKVYKKLQVNNFGSDLTAGGWNNTIHRRMIGDVNADGKMDIVGFGHSEVIVSLATSNISTLPDDSGLPTTYERNGFEYANTWAWDFCDLQGWDINENPIVLADINADQAADIVGFSDAGVRIALGKTDGTIGFTEPTLVITNFGKNPTAGGWNHNDHLRLVEDINGDGRADIVGFGWSDVIVSLSTGSGFTWPTTWLTGMSYAQGWEVGKHPRKMADVDNDGDLDIVGFHNDGVYVCTNTGSNFSSPVFAKSGFGYSAAAGGWRTDEHLRFCEDINNDNYPDLVGFYNDGVIICMGSATGFGYFASWTPDFGKNDGWSTSQHVRSLEDINGDGYLDIVGYGKLGVEAALNLSGACSEQFRWRNYYGNHPKTGNYNPTKDVRLFGDYTGDGNCDIITFTDQGVMASPSSRCFRPLYEEEVEPLGNTKSIDQPLSEIALDEHLDIQLYPNPSNGIFRIKFDDSFKDKSAELEIHNTAGILVFSKTLSAGMLQNELIVETKLPVGAYTIRLNIEDNRRWEEKLLIFK